MYFPNCNLSLYFPHRHWGPIFNSLWKVKMCVWLSTSSQNSADAIAQLANNSNASVFRTAGDQARNVRTSARPPTDPPLGPASTRYSTSTRIFLSYSNSTRTKHYSDRVASSKTPRISTIIQKQPARRYFRIITANPDIQCSPPWERGAVIWMLKR